MASALNTWGKCLTGQLLIISTFLTAFALVFLLHGFMVTGRFRN